MAINQEMVKAACEIMNDIQSRVYFNKLASLGIVPATKQEENTLWELGDSVLQERPRLSNEGRETKQASFETFGSRSSQLAADGCSVDAHQIVEELCKDPAIVKAAHILLSVNNA